MSEQADVKKIVAWVMQMTPETSLEKIYKVASASPELENIDKQLVMDAIHGVLRDRTDQKEERNDGMKKAKEKKKEGIADRKDYLYGRYRIVSGFKDNQYLANAYTDTGSRLIASLDGESEETVTQLIKQQIDRHVEHLQNSRQDDGTPSPEEYGEAFECLKGATSRQVARVLKFYTEEKNGVITIKQMMKDIDCVTLEEADDLCIKVARSISSYTGFRPESSELPQKLKPFCAIAMPNLERDQGVWEWSVRPQVAEALKQVRL